MYLVVHIPFRADEESARALGLARQAPSFTLEWSEGQQFAIAIFPSLQAEIDKAMQLIGEAARVPGAWASTNSKRVSGLTKLWLRLSCYRESLDVSDALRYCRDKSGQFNDLVGCKENHCPVPCQFICTPCLRLEREGLAVGSVERYKIAAELAEIDWCPKLMFPENDKAVIIEPRALKPQSAPAS